MTDEKEDGTNLDDFEDIEKMVADDENEEREVLPSSEGGSYDPEDEEDVFEEDLGSGGHSLDSLDFQEASSESIENNDQRDESDTTKDSGHKSSFRSHWKIFLPVGVVALAVASIGGYKQFASEQSDGTNLPPENDLAGLEGLNEEEGDVPGQERESNGKQSTLSSSSSDPESAPPNKSGMVSKEEDDELTLSFGGESVAPSDSPVQEDLSTSNTKSQSPDPSEESVKKLDTVKSVSTQTESRSTGKSGSSEGVDFKNDDYVYLQMESMLDDYADEAGYIDNEELASRLESHSSALKSRVSKIESRIADAEKAISNQEKTDKKHSRRINSIEDRLSVLESETSVKPLPSMGNRTRLKGFKIISSSSDGSMVTAKTPSGEAQVFFEGEMLFIRGRGSLIVTEIQGSGRRVLVGENYYFDETHEALPQKTASSGSRSDTSDKEESSSEKEKSSSTKVKDSSSDKKPSEAEQDKDYIIAESKPDDTASEVGEKDYSSNGIVTSEKSSDGSQEQPLLKDSGKIAKGWIVTGSASSGESFLVRSPQSNWHVVKKGDQIDDLGRVEGETRKGALKVGDYLIRKK